MNIRRESVLAIVFSVLLVTSLAAPVLGASASNSPEPADGAASVADVQPELPSIQNEEQNESTVPANQSDSSNESGDQSEPLEESAESETTNETVEQTETATESTGSETVNEPAEASETPDEPSEPPETANESGAPNLTDEYLTPVERLTLARASISDLENASDGERTHLNGSAAHLDDSLEHYERYRATDRQAYDQQARALHELARAADEGDEEMAEIGRAISTASNDSARIAVHETDVALETFEGEMNEHRHGEAERALGDAERALERGDSALAEASTYSTGREIRTRADAIDHYREAAHHADRALETVEREVDPELEAVSSQPIEVNETVHVRIDAAVVAPDAAAFDDGDLEASVDGGSAADASLTAVGSGTTSAGTLALEFDPERTENVTVEVRAVSADGEDELGEDVTVDLRSETVRTIRDPETSYTVEAGEESTGVTVEATGDGLGPTDLSVANQTPSSEDDYRAGPMVRIENRSPIDEAEVTIPLADGVDPEDGNLSMYTWDPTSEEPWVPVETEIDHENGTATAEVEHFSFFSVFWIGEWEAATSDGMVLEERHLAGNETTGGDDEVDGEVDIVLVVDESGSMSGSPIHYAREAAKRFVGALSETEQAGLVGYASSASIDRSLTTDHDSLNASIETLSAGGGTHTEAGLREGLDELERNSWENRSSVIILLSDGKSNSGSYPRRVAEDAADRDVEISTVGLGSSIDENELQDIASITGGDYYHVETAADLPETFERVAANQTSVALRDTNDDGIPDAVAEMDLRMPTGSGDVVGEPVDIHPTDRDTSSDGLEDHEQVEIEYEVHQDGDEYVLKAEVTDAIAIPGRSDTANNGLSDYEEVEIWETDPLLADTSGDGFIDSVDPDPHTKQTPPNVEYSVSGAAGAGAVFVEDDREIESVEFHGYYDPFYGSGYWDKREPVATHESDNWTRYGFVIHDRLVTRPDELYINVTDTDGYTVSYRAEASSAYSGLEIASVSVITPGVDTPPRRPNPTPRKVLRGTASRAGVYSVVLFSWGHTFKETAKTYDDGSFEEETELVVPTTGIEKEFPTSDHRIDSPEITLPSGVSYPHESEDGHERKHGWEQIVELPGVNQPEDLEQIIEAPNAVDQDGRYDLIIGDNPGGPGQIILRVYEGYLLFAGQLIEDPTGHHVEIDRNDDHMIDREDHPTWDETEHAIRNPSQIWENDVGHGLERHYIVQIDNKWVVVRAYWEGSKWIFSTAVEYASKGTVEEYIEDRNLDERIYGAPL
ncbi:VWA domain-containing protein [Natrarchaeobius sp. A-rgal3]|uniref:VWA domain-containing protein n=1 Tax=Natrarchaeobius versutus TaxID=1679078 RepID=UPI00350FAEA6